MLRLVERPILNRHRERSEATQGYAEV